MTWNALAEERWRFTVMLDGEDEEALARADRTEETHRQVEGGVSKRLERELAFSFGSDVDLDKVSRFQVRILPLDDASEPYVPTFGVSRAARKGIQRQILLHVGNQSWTYFAYLPEQYVKQEKRGVKKPRHPKTEDGRWPLVVSFNGARPFDGPIGQVATWYREADRYGFIVVVPRLFGDGSYLLARLEGWDIDSTPEVWGATQSQSTAYVREGVENAVVVMRDAMFRWPIATDHVLATGWLTGGTIAHSLVNRHPELFSCLAVRQAPFSADFLDPARVKEYASMPIGVFWTQKDFAYVQSTSRRAVEWYRKRGCRDVSLGVFAPPDHRRMPEVAATFFAMHCGITPRRPVRFRRMVESEGRTRAAYDHALEGTRAPQRTQSFHVFPDSTAKQVGRAYQGFAEEVIEADFSEEASTAAF